MPMTKEQLDALLAYIEACITEATARYDSDDEGAGLQEAIYTTACHDDLLRAFFGPAKETDYELPARLRE